MEYGRNTREASGEKCDCWTDADGNWQLGPKCLEAEHATWRAMFDRIPDLLGDLARANDRKISYKFLTVDGKPRLIENIELPETDDE
jgi:hypothetical protein